MGRMADQHLKTFLSILESTPGKIKLRNTASCTSTRIIMHLAGGTAARRDSVCVFKHFSWLRWLGLFALASCKGQSCPPPQGGARGCYAPLPRAHTCLICLANHG